MSLPLPPEGVDQPVGVSVDRAVLTSSTRCVTAPVAMSYARRVMKPRSSMTQLWNGFVARDCSQIKELRRLLLSCVPFSRLAFAANALQRLIDR